MSYDGNMLNFFALLALSFSHFVAASPNATVTIPDSMKSCKTKADCREVETRCDACCGVGAIANGSLADFSKLKTAFCASIKITSICDCMPAKHHLECIHSKCEVVFEKVQ